MGELQLTLMDYYAASLWDGDDRHGGILAGVCLLRWALKNVMGTFSGHTLETYVWKEGKCYVAHDASI